MAIDLRAGMKYREAHIPGSTWAIRPRLAEHLRGEKRAVVLIADEPAVARWASLELEGDISLLDGGLTEFHSGPAPRKRGDVDAAQLKAAILDSLQV